MQKNSDQQPRYTGKGKKPAALVRSSKGSQAIMKKNGDPCGLLGNCKKR